MSYGTYVENPKELSDKAKGTHRLLQSLCEELEAVDWYQQRMDVCKDEAAGKVLRHNKNEEWSHAVMLLEILRRKNPELDADLKKYLFTKGDLGD